MGQKSFAQVAGWERKSKGLFKQTSNEAAHSKPNLTWMEKNGLQ